MYLIIDNYDSFTYNLYQYLTQIYSGPVTVVRNDRITTDEIERLNPEGIIISPGPGRPEEAGICIDTVNRFAGKIPILGVCLGHQAIGAAFGAGITGARRIVHGKTDEVTHDGRGLFRNIPSPVRFTRYHSLALWRQTLPGELEVSATSSDGEIMGVRHRSYTVEGIQFHPESIASEFGMKILQNFLHYRRDTLKFSVVISGILTGDELTPEQSASIMEDITEGDMPGSQVASFLTAMNTRTVSAGELYGMASVLDKKMTSIENELPALDTCGTGGDGAGTLNISSITALVAAACGIRVVKHGNRSVSSRSGSADFFESLGLPVDLDPESAARLLEEEGFTFLFAPLYHGSMRHVARVRRDLGIKTVMNLLGPLVNPARPSCQLIGVHHEALLVPMAEAAVRLGRKSVMTVHSVDGLDEISPCAPTRAVHIDEHGTSDFIIRPEELGIGPCDRKCDLSELVCSSPGESVEIGRDLLRGRGLGPEMEMDVPSTAVVLNAGAGLLVSGVTGNLEEGVARAREVISSGEAAKKLERIIRAAVRLKGESVKSGPQGVSG